MPGRPDLPLLDPARRVAIAGNSPAGAALLLRVLARAGLDAGRSADALADVRQENAARAPRAAEAPLFIAPDEGRDLPAAADAGQAPALVLVALETGVGVGAGRAQTLIAALAGRGVPTAVLGYPAIIRDPAPLVALSGALGLSAAALRAAHFHEAAPALHPFTPQAAGPRHFFSIKELSPTQEFRQGCGDYYFAESLARAFRRLGHEAEVVAQPDWRRPPRPNQIDINLRGQARMERRDGVPLLVWLIYPGHPSMTVGEIGDADHIFCASAMEAEKLARLGGDAVGYLPQAFDPEIMAPPAAGAARRGLLFVANNHFHAARATRPIAAVAHEAGAELDIWGKYWDATPLAGQVRGAVLPNARLGGAYRGAEAVLCDHLGVMREAGYVSNRMFDALACGAPIISDPILGAPQEFLDFVYVAKDAASFRGAVRAIRAEDATRRAERLTLAAAMRTRHSFDQRAAEIIETVARRRLTP